MSFLNFRDSWEVWRRKVDAALGGAIESVNASDVSYNGTSAGLVANNVQTAIDEVAGVVDTKLQYISMPNVVSIFDLMNEAEGSRIYVGYATKFTDGATDLKTLLSISQYARVELFNYNKYLAILRITNTDGVMFVGYAGAELTTLNLMKIDTTGNSVVTINKAE